MSCDIELLTTKPYTPFSFLPTSNLVRRRSTTACPVSVHAHKKSSTCVCEYDIYNTVLYMIVERRKNAAAQQSDCLGIVVHLLPESTATVTESIHRYSDEQKCVGIYPW